MKTGTLNRLLSKRNTLNKTYVVLYPNIEELVENRLFEGAWLPITTTQPTSVNHRTRSLKRQPLLKSVDETFLLVETWKDVYGTTYLHCLYNDSDGWIVDNTREYVIKEVRQDNG